MWCGVLAAVAIGNWARWVEPQMLEVRETTFTGLPAGAPPLRIALVSDIHLGTYVRQWHLEKLVRKLNDLDVDVVVVAGDWTYEPPLDLTAAFAPIGRIRHPVLAVLGNHDVEKPGPALQAQLREALEKHRVTFLEGKSIPFKGWEWVGIGDYWGGHPEADVKAVLSTPNPRRIVVTHQPDAVSLFPKQAAFLTLAGHTHGGQIQVPWLTVKNMELFTDNPWYNGRYDLPQSTLFVTTGTGFTGLPARWLMPPRVDLLILQR
jgi:predicted MPP superfamily phosphohydrolase